MLQAGFALLVMAASTGPADSQGQVYANKAQRCATLAGTADYYLTPAAKAGRPEHGLALECRVLDLPQDTPRRSGQSDDAASAPH